VEGKYIRMMIQLNNKVTGNRAALYILGMLNTEETKDDVDQKKKKKGDERQVCKWPTIDGGR
jgi:hypothetical protein